VILALNTGLRLGELLGLTWERVDLSRGVIRLELTKNGRRREIPMNNATYGTLVGLGPKASGRVFKTRYLKTAYNNAVEAAQLDDVTFHTLGHTFASWAVMRGFTLKELQELLGHSSLAMTIRYAHLAPEHPPHGGQPPGRPHNHRARQSFSTIFSTRACRDRGGVAEVSEVVGSPGWARTSDFLINRRGPATSRPLVFLRSSAQGCAAARFLVACLED
jgi:hypothetical protein